MTLDNILSEIDELKKELDDCYPLPADRLQKINYKFRLEWNYHSNKMEGGTLTYEETRSVMMEQLEIHGKPLRDVLEMRGHDEIIKNIQKLGRGDLKLTENRIKEIHKAIIFDEKDMPGQFKNLNNYIYNYAGERFDFTPREETINALNTLTNWLDNELKAINKNKSKKTIPEIAFDYHLRFLTIHPFLDGNGRTGRILLNLILIANGYPPIIIRTEEKEAYSKHIAHAQQYEENPIPLYEMLGNLLIRSFETCIKGAKGENVFELEDWEKRLQLLEYQALSDNKALLKSNETVYLTIKNSIIPFLDYADSKFSSFNRLFENNSRTIKMDIKNDSPYLGFDIKKQIEYEGIKSRLGLCEGIDITYEWRNFKIFGKQINDLKIILKVLFKNDSFQIIRLDFPTPTIEKRYSDILKQEEITAFINAIGNNVADELEKKFQVD